MEAHEESPRKLHLLCFARQLESCLSMASAILREDHFALGCLHFSLKLPYQSSHWSWLTKLHFVRWHGRAWIYLAGHASCSRSPWGGLVILDLGIGWVKSLRLANWDLYRSSFAATIRLVLDFLALFFCSFLFLERYLSWLEAIKNTINLTNLT